MGDTKKRRTTSNANLAKGAVAGVVIVACIAYFTFLAFSGKPTVIASNADPAVAAWMQALTARQSEIYQQMEKVAVHPAEDGKSIVVSGTVSSKSDLAKLKAVLEGIEPKAPLTWEVSVGR